MEPQEHDELLRTLGRIAAHQETMNNDQREFNRQLVDIAVELKAIHARTDATLTRTPGAPGPDDPARGEREGGLTLAQETIAMRPCPMTHPGGILKHHSLEPLGMGIAQAAEALGVSRPSLSKIVHAHRAVTPDMALRLAKALHTTPELWLTLQQTYDLWHAARESQDWRQVQELVAEGLTYGSR